MGFPGEGSSQNYQSCEEMATLKWHTCISLAMPWTLRPRQPNITKEGKDLDTVCIALSTPSALHWPTKPCQGSRPFPRTANSWTNCHQTKANTVFILHIMNSHHYTPTISGEVSFNLLDQRGATRNIKQTSSSSNCLGVWTTHALTRFF